MKIITCCNELKSLVDSNHIIYDAKYGVMINFSICNVRIIGNMHYCPWCSKKILLETI